MQQRVARRQGEKEGRETALEAQLFQSMELSRKSEARPQWGKAHGKMLNPSSRMPES